MAVPHDAVATVGQFQVLPLGDEGAALAKASAESAREEM
jgi:hypothetical protein